QTRPSWAWWCGLSSGSPSRRSGWRPVPVTSAASRQAEAVTEQDEELRRAAEVMDRVRAHCVWSQQMTHDTLVPYLTEEAAEVIDAVESGSAAELREELGDLLWQVLFHSAVSDAFTIDDVAGDLAEKMTRRHP